MSYIWWVSPRNHFDAMYLMGTQRNHIVAFNGCPWMLTVSLFWITVNWWKHMIHLISVHKNHGCHQLTGETLELFNDIPWNSMNFKHYSVYCHVSHGDKKEPYSDIQWKSLMNKYYSVLKNSQLIGENLWCNQFGLIETFDDIHLLLTGKYWNSLMIFL